ncbi:unnamed protein product [Agarophyton chilense]
MTELFHPSDNELLDLNPLSPPPPKDPTVSFLQSYLTYRTRPPFRPCTTTPYTQYDSFLFTHLTSQLVEFSPENILDLTCLFPPSSLQLYVPTILHSIKPSLSRVVRSLHNRLRSNDLYFVADSLHMLASLASADDASRSAVIEALSTRSQRADAADKVQAWLRDLTNKPEGDLFPNGLTQRQMCVGLASQLFDALLSLPQFERVGYVRLNSSDARVETTIARVADIPVSLAREALQKFGGADAAVAALLDGWRPQLGKRANKDDRPKERVDTHQIQRRIARDDARRQAEEERDVARNFEELTVQIDGDGEGAGGSTNRAVDCENQKTDGHPAVTGLCGNVLGGEKREAPMRMCVNSKAIDLSAWNNWTAGDASQPRDRQDEMCWCTDAAKISEKVTFRISSDAVAARR